MTTLEKIIDQQIRKWELEKKRREEEQQAQTKEIFPGPVISVSEKGVEGVIWQER